jgi:hypothetical protein
MRIIVLSLFLTIIIASCGSSKKISKKGFHVVEQNDVTSQPQEIINKDTLPFISRPSDVLLTGIPSIRLASIFKLSYSKNLKNKFLGSVAEIYSDNEYANRIGNNWNGNYIPGFKVVYGYNFVNVAWYDILKNTQKNFFEKPVLIKSLYYPSNTKDTLDNKAVQRDFFMVSVYNEDTNKDGVLNTKDLRRFYLFNQLGEVVKPIVPIHFSVYKSEYDPINDVLFVFAHEDVNKNGQLEDIEPIHVYWINLKDTTKTGILY